MSVKVASISSVCRCVSVCRRGLFCCCNFPSPALPPPPPPNFFLPPSLSPSLSLSLFLVVILLHTVADRSILIIGGPLSSGWGELHTGTHRDTPTHSGTHTRDVNFSRCFLLMTMRKQPIAVAIQPRCHHPPLRID